MIRKPRTRPAAPLALGALGVVFGDIGTSPLYTLKTVLFLSGDAPSAPVILGLLSLIFWTLVIVTSLKYAMFAMRIGNRGEGGIMALMSLLVSRRKSRPLVLFAGLFGAALIYGDGAITPAISVLSALEGLNIVLPASQPYILPAAVVILLSLFAIQPLGIGRATDHGAVVPVDRRAGRVGHHPASGGAVGAEPAVRHSFPVLERADQLHGAGRRVSVRHRRRSAVRRHGALRQTADLAGWFGIVFPSLLLNYAGGPR